MNETTSPIVNLEEELYENVVNNEKINSKEWDSLSLVFSRSGNSRFGYRYFGDDWEAFGPSGFDWLKPANSLHQAMSEGGRPWIKMLMCLNKEKKSFTTEYEFEDADRWSLGGKDIGSIEEFAYSLKRD